MRRIVQVYIRPDLYEATMDGNVLVQLIRYTGESQWPQEVDFNRLDVKKQDLIIAAIQSNE